MTCKFCKSIGVELFGPMLNNVDVFCYDCRIKVFKAAIANGYTVSEGEVKMPCERVGQKDGHPAGTNIVDRRHIPGFGHRIATCKLCDESGRVSARKTT